MAELDPKSESVHNMLEDLVQGTFGVSRKDCITNDVCIRCKGPAKEFEDELSATEFTISGFCQSCQKEIGM